MPYYLKPASPPSSLRMTWMKPCCLATGWQSCWEACLRQVGRPQDVFTAPSDGEVASFVGVETVIAGKVAVSQNGQVIVEADGLNLEAVGDIPIGTQVLFCLRPEDITLSKSSETSISSARNHVHGSHHAHDPQWTARAGGDRLWLASRRPDHAWISQ